MSDCGDLLQCLCMPLYIINCLNCLTLCQDCDCSGDRRTPNQKYNPVYNPGTVAPPTGKTMTRDSELIF